VAAVRLGGASGGRGDEPQRGGGLILQGGAPCVIPNQVSAGILGEGEGNKGVESCSIVNRGGRQLHQ
jgi:hypothetical protein